MTEAQSISIHALLAESDHPNMSDHPHNTISIHALLAESDIAGRITLNGTKFLSTLSLRRATVDTVKLTNAMLFLSTLSLRRATRKLPMREPTALHFYPRSPCGERQVDTLILTDAMRFLSTLSLRRATVVDNIIFVPGQFLSTLSLRRATPRVLREPATSRFLSTLSLRRATKWIP